MGKRNFAKFLPSKAAQLREGRAQGSLWWGAGGVVSEHLAVPAVQDAAKETISPELHPEY